MHCRPLFPICRLSFLQHVARFLFPVVRQGAFNSPFRLSYRGSHLILCDCWMCNSRFRKLCTSLDSTLQIFGYKCLGEGDEQTGGFFGGNVGNVEVHQARISDGVLNFPLLD